MERVHPRAQLHSAQPSSECYRHPMAGQRRYGVGRVFRDNVWPKVSDPVDRIKAAYSRRRERGLDARYSPWASDVLFMRQDLERAVLKMLARNGFRHLEDVRILDVGCGTGGLLRTFVEYGAATENLVGVDLLKERVAEARRLSPQIDFRVANGARLPFEGDTVDLALAFTIFSSIPDPGLRKDVAAEILRVLRPGGGLLWYDFWINPVNPEVEALGLPEVRRLFGREPADARRVTLAPPISRFLAPRSLVACQLLAKIPFLRTHWLALVRS
jgi:SAM-dependent methyltransferase